MNKEETIIKYFSGTYAYDLFLMGMIFGNPIYSEYISNKEYLNGAIVGNISSIFLAIKEKMVDKNNNILLPISLMEKNVNIIANKTIDGYEINGYTFKDSYTLVTTIRNKLGHGEYLIDFAHNRVILKVSGNDIVIPIPKLTNFVISSFSSTLQNYNTSSFTRCFVYSKSIIGKDKERYSLNEYKNKIEVQKEVLLSLPRNNNKNEKIYQAKIGELLEELQKEKEVVASEIRKRRDRYLSLEHDKSIDLLTKEIDLLLPSIHLLNNYNSSYEKSGLDIILYELGHFYKTDLEKVNKDIIKVLTIFSTVGVTLTEEDFNYSYYSDKYMRKILLQSTSEEELKKHFEEIYWKCPNIITHITLNLKYLYYKNKKKFDLYYENKVKELEDRNIIEAYKELYIEREQKVKNDAYLLQGSFLEGKLNIGDYTLDKINKAYKSVIEDLPSEKINSDILKLYHSLIEYKNYLEFNYIINDIKEEK